MTQIWLPPSAAVHNQKPSMFCTVIVDVDGNKCGKPFYPGEEKNWERHVVACSRKHEAEIRHASPKNRLPGWLSGDTGVNDIEEWLDTPDASGTTHRQKVIEKREKF